MRLLSRVPCAAIVMGLLLGAPAGRAAEPSGKESVWEGTLKIRPGSNCTGGSSDEGDGGNPTGTLDSPDEGFKGLKLSSITLDKSRLAFELKVSGARI